MQDAYALTGYEPDRRARAGAAVIAVAIEGLLVVALVVGLAGHGGAAVDSGLKLFGVVPEAPPPPVRIVASPARNTRPEGAAAPANLRSKATELVAPVPVVAPLVSPPLIAATVAGVGAAATTGAAAVPGPGTGAGGEGDGAGSGGSGDGDGGGWRDETPPRHVGGRLKDSDYPRAAKEAFVEGTVGVRYLVGVTGRVSQCEVTRSSGSSELDGTTCRLIEQRFRYKPSRNARGWPVPAVIVENHSWIVGDE